MAKSSAITGRDGKDASDSMMGMKWHSMLGLSILFHFAVFSFFLFVPEAMPTRQFDGIIYSVDLVEMPAQNALELRQSKAATEKKSKTVVNNESQAKRVSRPKKEKKPLVIAKRTVETRKALVKKSETSSAERIEDAISKLEDKAQSKEESENEQEAHLERALASLESRFTGLRRGVISIDGIPMQIYRMEVEDRIYNNWTYPDRKDLKAIVVLTVRRDGTILETKIKRRSGDFLFDESVMKAVKRSDPLPPFPEVYKKSYGEIEIIFNPQNS
jgi:colicin import membrane protein